MAEATKKSKKEKKETKETASSSTTSAPNPKAFPLADAQLTVT